MCASLSQTWFIYLSISNEINTPDGMFHVNTFPVFICETDHRHLKKGGPFQKTKQNKQGKVIGTNCLSHSNMTNQISSLSVERVGNSAMLPIGGFPLLSQLSPTHCYHLFLLKKCLMIQSYSDQLKINLMGSLKMNLQDLRQKSSQTQLPFTVSKIQHTLHLQFSPLWKMLV